jgi:hypothetical protein
MITNKKKTVKDYYTEATTKDLHPSTWWTSKCLSSPFWFAHPYLQLSLGPMLFVDILSASYFSARHFFKPFFMYSSFGPVKSSSFCSRTPYSSPSSISSSCTAVRPFTPGEDSPFCFFRLVESTEDFNSAWTTHYVIYRFYSSLLRMCEARRARIP